MLGPGRQREGQLRYTGTSVLEGSLDQYHLVHTEVEHRLECRASDRGWTVFKISETCPRCLVGISTSASTASWICSSRVGVLAPLVLACGPRTGASHAEDDLTAEYTFDNDKGLFLGLDGIIREDGDAFVITVVVADVEMVPHAGGDDAAARQLGEAVDDPRVGDRL